MANAPRTRKKKLPPVPPEILQAIEQASERSAKRATNRALKQFLLALGINAETAEDMKASQQDAAWTRRARIATESTPAKVGVAFMGFCFTLLGGLITLGVKKIMNW